MSWKVQCQIQVKIRVCKINCNKNKMAILNCTNFAECYYFNIDSYFWQESGRIYQPSQNYCQVCRQPSHANNIYHVTMIKWLDNRTQFQKACKNKNLLSTAKSCSTETGYQPTFKTGLYCCNWCPSNFFLPKKFTKQYFLLKGSGHYW